MQLQILSIKIIFRTTYSINIIIIQFEGVEDVEINVEDGESSEDEEKENKLQVIPEASFVD